MTIAVTLCHDIFVNFPIKAFQQHTVAELRAISMWEDRKTSVGCSKALKTGKKNLKMLNGYEMFSNLATSALNLQKELKFCLFLNKSILILLFLTFIAFHKN